jgi:hypothetical protein
VDADRLFLETLLELNRYLTLGDDYSMLRAAALLRQMLMDQRPLVHQANRSHKLKLRFVVCGRHYREVVLGYNPGFYSSLGGIHVSGPFPQQAEELSLDQYLATPVLKLGSHLLSIGDLISISANVLGGVHKGDPKTEKEHALAAFNNQVSAFGQTIGAAQLRPALLIAIEAMEPLRQAVQAAS